jgi:ribonuclease Z
VTQGEVFGDQGIVGSEGRDQGLQQGFEHESGLSAVCRESFDGRVDEYFEGTGRMSLEYRVLGSLTGDNSLLVTVDSGQAVTRLLFDCGGGCLDVLSPAEILGVDHLFFSHLHMDHVAGFDAFFRRVYARVNRENHIWGPPETTAIMHHRFQGFMWNLREGGPVVWRVHDVDRETVRTRSFRLEDGFRAGRDEGERLRAGALWENEALVVEAITLDHKVPSLGYRVREKSRRNVDGAKLAALGLEPGPWLAELKAEAGPERLEIGGRSFRRQELLGQLITEAEGVSVAYLTDFRLDAQETARVARFLEGSRTLVCEGNYHPRDLESAQRNYHLTTVQAAELARMAGVGELLLTHMSDRYVEEERREMLEAARAVFPEVRLVE